MVKFSQDVWDSFDAVAQRSEVGAQVVRDLHEFLKKRAEIEMDYAKRMAALCNTKPSGGLFSKSERAVDKDASSIRLAINSAHEEGGKIANAHLEFANKIQAELVKPLESFIKSKDADRKKVVAEGQKRTKIVVDAKVQAEKSRELYVKISKEAETATEAHDKASKELAADTENKKLKEAEKKAGQRVAPTVDKAKQAETAYHKAVEVANDHQSKNFGEHMPTILDALQQYEEERFAQIRSCVGEYLKLHKSVYHQADGHLMELAKTIDAMDNDADIAEFVKSHAAESNQPTPILILGFKDAAAPPPPAVTPKDETTPEKEPDTESKDL